jgi:hypothetical protein
MRTPDKWFMRSTRSVNVAAGRVIRKQSSIHGTQISSLLMSVNIMSSRPIISPDIAAWLSDACQTNRKCLLQIHRFRHSEQLTTICEAIQKPTVLLFSRLVPAVNSTLYVPSLYRDLSRAITYNPSVIGTLGRISLSTSRQLGQT